MRTPVSVNDLPAVDELVGDPVVAEAKKRFMRCNDWEGSFRPRFVDDLRFRHGDSDNGYQWPNAIRRNRDNDSKPCLTMNVVKQHNLQISNEARKNKSQIKIVPTGGGATQDAAGIIGDLVRHVETQSQAQDIYTLARNFQVDGGIGYWRLTTDYLSPTTFDQEIYICPVNDPLKIFIDPDIQKKDGSDARFAFAFDDVPRDEFKEAYPDYYGLVGETPLGVGVSDDDWDTKDHIRIVEYFRKVNTPDTLISFVHMGERKTILRSKLPKNIPQAILADPLTKTREVMTEKVEWKLIAGEKVIDETVWMGKFIPIIRVVGEEYVLEGVMDRKGHTRGMKDAQRMLNYNASAQVEFVALQGKTPWIASAKAIEEYETLWNTANVANHSVLVWNHLDDEGNPIPPPSRTDPPTASPAYQQGMETAFNQMMMVSGQWQNQMGMGGNERTGKAIGLRQSQGDTATFHFQDNYESALQFTGRQLIDLFPKIYDTKRVVQIVAEDGTTLELQIDPSAKKAFEIQQAENGETISRIFNPNVGIYDVAPSVGPAYGSKKEQGVEALTLILTQAPDMVPVIGDLMIGEMDFEGAKEAARRLKRLVPPAALGEGPTANEQKLTAAVQSLQNALAESLQRQGKTELKLVGKEQMRDIDVAEANTKRLTALKDYLPADPEGLRALIVDVINDALKGDLGAIIDANANNLDIDGSTSKRAASGEAPAGGSGILPPNAEQAPDGKHYIPDPKRPGKYLLVEPA